MEQDGEVVTMHVPELPVSSNGGFHVNWKSRELTVLAEEMRTHGYLKTPKDKLKSWVAPRLWANLFSGMK